MDAGPAPCRSNAECGKLPLLFAKYADNGDHAALAELFTDGLRVRPAVPARISRSTGATAVQAIFRDRPPILVRHIVTNVLVEAVSKTRGDAGRITSPCSPAMPAPSRRRKRARSMSAGSRIEYVLDSPSGELALCQSRHGNGRAAHGRRDAQYSAAERRSERTEMMVEQPPERKRAAGARFLRGAVFGRSRETARLLPREIRVGAQGQGYRRCRQARRAWTSSTSSSPRCAACSNPGDPKVHVQNMFSAGPWVCVESNSTGKTMDGWSTTMTIAGCSKCRTARSTRCANIWTATTPPNCSGWNEPWRVSTDSRS